MPRSGSYDPRRDLGKSSYQSSEGEETSADDLWMFGVYVRTNPAELWTLCLTEESASIILDMLSEKYQGLPFYVERVKVYDASQTGDDRFPLRRAQPWHKKM